MTFRHLVLAVAASIAGICAVAPAQCGAADWQVEAAPALAPGRLGDWDDFRVSHPCVLRTGRQWRMYYQGGRLDENGLTYGIGLATSTDGVHWRKLPQNPLIEPEVSPQTNQQSSRAWSPTVCRLADGSFLMLYFEQNLSNGKFLLAMARSPDGIAWRRSAKAEPWVARVDKETPFSLSLFEQANPQRRQLWYLAPNGDRRSLAHVASYAGGNWSDVLRQSARDIDRDGSMERAQVVPSGDYYLLSYMVAKDDRWQKVAYRFRVSSDARNWLPEGPPDFVPAGAESYGGLAVVYTSEGARLFYHEEQADGGRRIRTALCPKARYRGLP